MITKSPKAIVEDAKRRFKGELRDAVLKVITLKVDILDSEEKSPTETEHLYKEANPETTANERDD
jgi:hypothetical protein